MRFDALVPTKHGWSTDKMQQNTHNGVLKWEHCENRCDSSESRASRSAVPKVQLCRTQRECSAFTECHVACANGVTRVTGMDRSDACMFKLQPACLQRGKCARLCYVVRCKVFERIHTFLLHVAAHVVRLLPHIEECILDVDLLEQRSRKRRLTIHALGCAAVHQHVPANRTTLLTPIDVDRALCHRTQRNRQPSRTALAYNEVPSMRKTTCCARCTPPQLASTAASACNSAVQRCVWPTGMLTAATLYGVTRRNQFTGRARTHQRTVSQTIRYSAGIV